MPDHRLNKQTDVHHIELHVAVKYDASVTIFILKQHHMTMLNLIRNIVHSKTEILPRPKPDA